MSDLEKRLRAHLQEPIDGDRDDRWGLDEATAWGWRGDALLKEAADTLAAVREWALSKPPSGWGHQPLYEAARKDVLDILGRSDTE